MLIGGHLFFNIRGRIRQKRVPVKLNNYTMSPCFYRIVLSAHASLNNRFRSARWSYGSDSRAATLQLGLPKMDPNINLIGTARIVNAFNQQFGQSISFPDVNACFPSGFKRVDPLHPQRLGQF